MGILKCGLRAEGRDSLRRCRTIHTRGLHERHGTVITANRVNSRICVALLG